MERCHHRHILLLGFRGHHQSLVDLRLFDDPHRVDYRGQVSRVQRIPASSGQVLPLEHQWLPAAGHLRADRRWQWRKIIEDEADVSGFGADGKRGTNRRGDF